jgi:diadenylate cyclase
LELINCESSVLRAALKKRLVEIAKSINETVAAFEQEHIHLLNVIDEITKRFVDTQATASTYYLNCILTEYSDHSKDLAIAMNKLSSKRYPAIMIIERNEPIAPYISKGIPIFAQVTSQMLETIFMPDSHLHGAVLIRNDTILSASHILPISEQIFWDGSINSATQSAVDLSKRTDALFLLVNESGTASYAQNGTLYSLTSK